MNVYSINYDLKAPKRNYTELYDAIKQSGNWWHYLDSTWLVASNETCQQIWNRISLTIDKNDFVLIIEVTNNKYGSLPKDAWIWIDTHTSI